MRYRPEIDGLRALAILPVIWFHAHLPGLPGGFAGVDVFFVISGFLITSLILSELAAGRFSVLHFYERRARRLLPALVLVVVACLPFAWLFMTPDQMEAFGRSVLSVALFASNIEFWQMTGYFAPSTAEIPLLHTWSLAVEEQFYLIFPPLLIVIWRVCPARLALILAIGCALSFAAALLLYRVGWGAAAFYLLPTRGWELLVGALAALWVRKHGLVERYAEGLAWIGLLALIVTYLGLDKFKPWPGPYTLMPVLGTCALLIALRPEGRLTRVLSSPVPVLIGLISYGAYLWHQPLFAFARLARLEAPSPMAMLALSCAALLLAWLSWRFVEQPIRRGVRISRQRVFAGSAVALTALLSLGAFGVVRHGLPERFSPEVVAILETATPAPHRAACHGIPSALTDPSEACVLGKGPPRWAVLGDSHGVELSYVLAEQLERKGEGLVQLTASGCPPALTFRSRSQGCSEWHERSVRWLEDNREIAHIILVYRHGGYLYGKNEVPVSDRVSAVLSGKSDQERERIYWASFETMLQR
ncbi:MAG: acyltransferase family protein, partial [Pseudomonadota bacterium]